MLMMSSPAGVAKTSEPAKGWRSTTTHVCVSTFYYQSEDVWGLRLRVDGP